MGSVYGWRLGVLSGLGYMFASAYPWGWMPYRYGNWMMVPGMGWMWQPGGWNNWVGVPRYTATGQRSTFLRLAPPPAGTVKTVYVGRAAAMSSTQLHAAIAGHSERWDPRDWAYRAVRLTTSTISTAKL